MGSTGEAGIGVRPDVPRLVAKPVEGRRTSVHQLVHLLRYCSNTPDLLTVIESALWMTQRDDLVDDPKLHCTNRDWRLKDRLSEQDMDDVVRAYLAGEAITIIARRYGINHWSVARLVRERGDRLRGERS